MLIIGCGYVGLQVAQLAMAKNLTVTALARSAASAQQLQQAGIPITEGDLDQPTTLTNLPTTQAVIYYFAPPPAHGKIDSRIRHFLQAMPTDAKPEKVILISTTGVYGDCQGQWIDETQPVNPQAERAKRRVDAEQQLQTWATQQQVDIVILRVPGIYGPGRLPLKRLQQQLPLLDPQIAPFSNRIHVHDLANACLAAATPGITGIFNITDGHPTTMTDYFFQVADNLGLPRPPSLDWQNAQQQLSSEMLSYLAESKRISNQKMQTVLGVAPRYPDLASGLAQCIQEEQNPFDN